MFALAGVLFAAFAARIPDLKSQLGLSAGQLGVTLLAVSAGSLLGLPSAGWAAHHLGAARAVRMGIGCAALGLGGLGVGVDLARSQPLVMVGLFLAGLGVGVWDVGMNLEGARVEGLVGRSLMPRFHAAFSGATVASALVGSGASALRVPILVHLGAVGVLVVGGGGYAVRRFLSRPAGAGGPGRPPGVGALAAWGERRTLLVGAVVFVAAVTEGTANDWLSVAMVEGHGLPAWAGVLAFATFLALMTLGRIAGLAALDRYGRVPVLRLLALLALIGALLVVTGAGALAFLGAAAWGLGASLGFPVGFSAAADDAERAPARISVVATIGYLGFLAGPPLLGFVGDRVGVLSALLAVGVLALVALALAPAVREPSRPR